MICTPAVYAAQSMAARVAGALLDLLVLDAAQVDGAPGAGDVHIGLAFGISHLL
jgi:hypothetical protein